MFIGLRHLFTYRECPTCGTLQLENVPDLAPYYQESRYTPLSASFDEATSRVARLARLLNTELSIHGLSLSRARDQLSPRWQEGLHWTTLLRAARVRRDSRILDVGCGAGAFLHQLHRNGFRDLTGIDPFLPGEDGSDGLRFDRVTLDEFDDGVFDAVFFNDSLEHVPNPRETLMKARNLLAPGGRIVVRIPLADSYAWRTYGTDWVQLDPPRHLMVPTQRGMRDLVAIAALRPERLLYDSWSFQFWGSEQYRRGIPLSDLTTPVFPKEQIRAWARQAKRLNRSGQGDHATFVLEAVRARKR
jgi:SAM-dependent methyltransferase